LGVSDVRFLSGEQPGVGGVFAHPPCDVDQRSGRPDRVAAEADLRSGAGNLQVPGGQADDPGGRLGVERDKASGESQSRLIRVVVQRAAQRRQPRAFVQRDH
jgi:hypothetical protein